MRSVKIALVDDNREFIQDYKRIVALSREKSRLLHDIKNHLLIKKEEEMFGVTLVLYR